MLRRREAEKELGVVGDQISSVDSGGLCHPLCQARLASEVAADEAAANAGDLHETRAVEQHPLGLVDVRTHIAAE